MNADVLTTRVADGIAVITLGSAKRIYFDAEMGGPGRPNTATPEHLFAAGYAACFGGSLDYVAKQNKRDASKGKVTCAVATGPRDGGGFGIAVNLQIEERSIDQADLARFVREAHEKICPYSHATRGNVPVTIEVIGK